MIRFLGFIGRGLSNGRKLGLLQGSYEKSGPLIAGEPNSIPVRRESFIRLNIQ